MSINNQINNHQTTHETRYIGNILAEENDTADNSQADIVNDDDISNNALLSNNERIKLNYRPTSAPPTLLEVDISRLSN